MVPPPLTEEYHDHRRWLVERRAPGCSVWLTLSWWEPEHNDHWVGHRTSDSASSSNFNHWPLLVALALISSKFHHLACWPCLPCLWRSRCIRVTQQPYNCDILLNDHCLSIVHSALVQPLISHTQPGHHQPGELPRYSAILQEKVSKTKWNWMEFSTKMGVF